MSHLPSPDASCVSHAETDPALYRRDGETFVPLRWSGGPWSPDAQFGGAPAALLCTLAEATPTPEPMQLARFTVDLLRPVPLRPLTASVRTVRAGRRIHLLEMSLAHGGTEVARATALRTRTSPHTEPWCTESHTPIWAPHSWQPDGLDPSPLPGGFDEAAELRFTAPGRYPCWARLNVPVIAGDEVRPSARVAFVADFASYIAQPPSADMSGINADLSINFIRPPQQGWLAIDGRGWLSSDGMSQVQGLITDAGGPVATVSMARLMIPQERTEQP
jgi:acyl-coenzyme A thioesterase PaaI-like protein